MTSGKQISNNHTHKKDKEGQATAISFTGGVSNLYTRSCSWL